MIDNLIIVALSSLLSGITIGTLLGTEVYKRRLTRLLVLRPVSATERH